MNNSVLIKKYSGEHEVFDINKLINSLRHAQADEDIVQDIALKIQDEIKEGMSTKSIYQMAYKKLKHRSKSGSARYKLKNAIMELGPTGYPFERFIGKILDYEGFKTEVGVVMQGHCVTHEVDVFATKANNHYLIECKFHSSQERICNVKTSLYIQSRVKDLEAQLLKNEDHTSKFLKGWIYTNTRFSSDALQFGECVGLGMVSWDHPPLQSLKDKIEQSRLYPITVLASMTKKDKQKVLNKGVVLCKEICADPTIFDEIDITASKKKAILKEAYELCEH